MFPILYQYKFITIGGYGIMLGLGFYLSFLLLEREFKVRNIDPELAYKILLVAIPGGIVGSKLFHILEHMDEFILNPVSMIFSGSGLSAYGGYVLSFIAGIYVIKRSAVSIPLAFDAASPSLALGYCFGRFGCHVAGDGCYGVETDSFLGTAYPNGIVPSTMNVLPTPLFEVFISCIAVGLLLNLRKKEMQPGKLFSLFLILSGLPRFLVEFVRRNPKLLFGLSQAQIIGIIFVIAGITGWIYLSGKEKQRAAV